MHRFFFLKKVTEELSSKAGKADWLCFGQSAFSGRSAEGCNSFVLGTGVQRPVGVKGCGSPVATFAVTPQKHRPTRSGNDPIGRLRAAAIIGSRVKRLAQGKLMPASTYTGYYLTQKLTGLAASPLLPFGAISQRLEGKELKLTRHNGRSGKHGTYNPRHNDRRFDLENSEHIDSERARKNMYWDCYRGFTTHDFRESPEQPDFSFEEIERMYYYEHYSDHVDAQNARNEKTRHIERNRTVDDLLKNNKTCPEESIYQIGTMEESIPPGTLALIVSEFYEEFERRFGSHIHILDWALHLDEGTPHIHERHVFDCKNRYGELCPQQEKALEELGVELPDPSKPKGKHNNRKQTFDAVCRTMLFDISRKHGVHLEQEPSYGGRVYLEKQDYILMKQKEQLAAQEQKLEELTLKIEDVETLLDDVSDAAYDKAVEVVTDTVRQETHKEDIRLVEESKKWVLSPERKAPKKERDYAAARLDGVITKIKRVMQNALAKIQKTLMQPEVKKAGKEQIKEKARESIREKLAKGRLNADRDNRERWEREGRIAPKKKHDMEL